MPEQLQVLDLALYSTCHVSGHELPPRDDLESNLLPSHLMHGQLDFAE